MSEETKLAGKFKSAEELEKAYQELEKKLGEQGSKYSDAKKNASELKELHEMSLAKLTEVRLKEAAEKSLAEKKEATEKYISDAEVKASVARAVGSDKQMAFDR